MIERRSEEHVSPVMTLWRGFRLLCPACGQGRLFQGPFRLNPTCPACGVRFERDEGQFTGAIYINMIVTELGFGLLFMVTVFLTEWSMWQQIAVCLGWTIGFPLLFHHPAKGLFCGVAHLSKGLRADSPAEAP